jgi:ribosomal protein L37AE/L43A
MALPMKLKCPVCGSLWLVYSKEPGFYRCRKCGSQFDVTRRAKSILFKVVSSGWTSIKQFEVEIPRRIKPYRR